MFGRIPSTGSRDIVGTRICHADTDTDADSALKPICPPSPLLGEITERRRRHDVFNAVPLSTEKLHVNVFLLQF